MFTNAPLDSGTSRFDEDKTNAYKAGMNWHIAKPIKMDELMSALKEILKERKETGERLQ